VRQGINWNVGDCTAVAHALCIVCYSLLTSSSAFYSVSCSVDVAMIEVPISLSIEFRRFRSLELVA